MDYCLGPRRKSWRAYFFYSWIVRVVWLQEKGYLSLMDCTELILNKDGLIKTHQVLTQNHFWGIRWSGKEDRQRLHVVTASAAKVWGQ